MRPGRTRREQRRSCGSSELLRFAPGASRAQFDPLEEQAPCPKKRGESPQARSERAPGPLPTQGPAAIVVWRKMLLLLGRLLGSLLRGLLSRLLRLLGVLLFRLLLLGFRLRRLGGRLGGLLRANGEGNQGECSEGSGDRADHVPAPALWAHPGCTGPAWVGASAVPLVSFVTSVR